MGLEMQPDGNLKDPGKDEGKNCQKNKGKEYRNAGGEYIHGLKLIGTCGKIFRHWTSICLVRESH